MPQQRRRPAADRRRIINYGINGDPTDFEETVIEGEGEFYVSCPDKQLNKQLSAALRAGGFVPYDEFQEDEDDLQAYKEAHQDFEEEDDDTAYSRRKRRR